MVVPLLATCHSLLRNVLALAYHACSEYICTYFHQNPSMFAMAMPHGTVYTSSGSICSAEDETYPSHMVVRNVHGEGFPIHYHGGTDAWSSS